MALELLTGILIVFSIALVVGMIFNRIKVPPLVAFILTGIIVGPYGLSIISDQEQVASLRSGTGTRRDPDRTDCSRGNK